MRAYMHLKHAAIIMSLLGLGLASCAKLKNEDQLAPTQVVAKIHPDVWTVKDDPGFHGKYLLDSLRADSIAIDSVRLRSCWTCHAKAYDGGTSGKSCYTSGCHSTYPHKSGWVDTASTEFHGKALRIGGAQLTDCATCHGAAYDGGSSGKSCYKCHASYPHKAEWLDPSASGSHGKFLKATNWRLSDCAGCHGDNFAGGGNTQMSCFRCHPSYPHTVFAAAASHAAYLRNKGYPLKGVTGCTSCHGASYTGGSVVDVSCSTSGCHMDNTGVAKSPEACNTCHGQFWAPAGDALSAAPPKSVTGDSLTTKPGVGAHAKHLLSGSLGKVTKCTECHVVPSTLFAAGHVDTPPPPEGKAEVIFNDSLARLTTGSGSYVPSPSYNPTNATCSNTYCHGNWQMTKAGSAYLYIFTDSLMYGNTANQPTWTAGSAGGACASCHGLPPTGHLDFPLSSCANCHGDVVNGSGNIINQKLHINGKANVFGQERSF